MVFDVMLRAASPCKDMSATGNFHVMLKQRLETIQSMSA